MTEPAPEPPTEPARDEPPPPEPAPRRPTRPPVWPYFLTPAAILIAAAAVVVAIILTDDDPPPAQEPIAPALEAVAEAADRIVAAAEATPVAPPRDPVTLGEALSAYAATLDLDADRFDACLADDATRAIVNGHLQRGIELGVNGTPTFFVNNKYISGAQPLSIFVEVIAAELAGSPTSIEEYSPAIHLLAGAEPPRFAILPERPDLTGAPIEGDPDAPVVLVEFSDFQCPFCQRWYYDSLPEIREQVGEDVAIAFLHFPLQQIHPNAAAAHFAAECAGEQGKFWEMHDLLFERQAEWSALPNLN